MMRTYASAVAISLLVSAAVGCLALLGAGFDSVGFFIVSPGLLSFAAASDMLAKPPIYQTIPLLVVFNGIWYLLLAGVFRIACWAICKGVAAVRPRTGAL